MTLYNPRIFGVGVPYIIDQNVKVAQRNGPVFTYSWNKKYTRMNSYSRLFLAPTVFSNIGSSLWGSHKPELINNANLSHKTQNWLTLTNN